MKLKSGELLNIIREICATTGASPMLVYLAEAHAAETWPLSKDAPHIHNNLEERIGAARRLCKEYPQLDDLLDGRVYVDGLDNATTLANGLWPERYLLLEGNDVVWASTLSFEERLADVPAQLKDAAHSLWA